MTDTNQAQQAVQPFADYMNTRLSEASSKAGIAGISSSALGIVQAVTLGLNGDIPTAITVGIPSLAGLYYSLHAIFTPEATSTTIKEAIPDDVLKATIATATRDQLISFLQQPTTAATLASLLQSTAGNNESKTSASNDTAAARDSSIS
jgi:hypothetical protein